MMFINISHLLSSFFHVHIWYDCEAEGIKHKMTTKHFLEMECKCDDALTLHVLSMKNPRRTELPYARYWSKENFQVFQRIQPKRSRVNKSISASTNPNCRKASHASLFEGHIHHDQSCQHHQEMDFLPLKRRWQSPTSLQHHPQLSPTESDDSWITQSKKSLPPGLASWRHGSQRSHEW